MNNNSQTVRPLSSHIENDYDRDNNDKLTKLSLNNLHSEQLSDGDNNRYNTLEIVNIFGGIDEILTHYLESNDITLNNNQLQQINQILITPQKYQQKRKAVPVIQIRDNKNNSNLEDCIDQYFNETFTFDVNDTYLHSLFHPKHANIIINVLHSNIVNILFGVVLSIAFVTSLVMDTDNAWILSICTVIELCLVLIPFTLFTILSFNRAAFKLVLGSFEFWFKFIYTLIAGVLKCWLEPYYGVLYFIHSLLYIIFVVLLIICISSLDAIQLR